MPREDTFEVKGLASVSSDALLHNSPPEQGFSKAKEVRVERLPVGVYTSERASRRGQSVCGNHPCRVNYDSSFCLALLVLSSRLLDQTNMARAKRRVDVQVL